MPRKHILYILLALLVLTSVIIVLTQRWFFSGISFNHTGEIGDTIGGISAPLVGIAGAYLVWLAFDEQRQYNIKQDNRFLGERWYRDNMEFLKEIKKNFLELSYEVVLYDSDKNPKNLKLNKTRVITPIQNYLKNYSKLKSGEKHGVDSYIFEFGFVLIQLNNLVSITVSKKDVYEEEVKDLLYNISLVYDMYFKYVALELLASLNDTNDNKGRRNKMQEVVNFLDSVLPSPIPDSADLQPR